MDTKDIKIVQICPECEHDLVNDVICFYPACSNGRGLNFELGKIDGSAICSINIRL